MVGPTTGQSQTFSMGKKLLVCCALLASVTCRPNIPSSYLAPRQLVELQPQASAPVSLYASPGAEPAPTRVISIKTLPDLEASQPTSLYSSPSELVRDFDYPEVNFLGDYDIQRAYDTDLIEVVDTPAIGEYGAPSDFSGESSEEENDINEAAASVVSTSVVQSVRARPVESKPIAIIRSEDTGVNDGRYHYSYETENGITQDVSGEMKMVNDNPVYVMRGSYSYPGTDGQIYQVDWYADETGYHPSAPHLPRSVQPDHPEVAAAVRAQLEFAAEEEAAAAAASTNNLVFVAPEDDLAGYGESLPGYN